MSFPVADSATVRRYVRGLIRGHARPLSGIVLWYILGAACGLAVPALLGNLVETIQDGHGASRLDITVAAIAGLLLLQGLLTRRAPGTCSPAVRMTSSRSPTRYGWPRPRLWRPASR
jgi:hypothetical protein